MTDAIARRILLTGGAGFIGSHFAEHALSQGAELVVVLDALTYAGRRDRLAAVEGDARFVFVHGDVCDRALLDRLFAEHDFDAVAHLAAESHVDRSIADGAPFVRTNVVGTSSVLDAARAAWTQGPHARQRADPNTDEGPHARQRADPYMDVTHARRLLHVSTDEVYGELGPTGRFTEASPYAPSSPYAASKAAGDHFARAYHRTYGLPVVVTHASNNYGPRQLADKLVPRAIRGAIDGTPIPLYGDGRHVRDWIYVEDHVRGLWAALTRGRPGETYGFGGGTELENRETVLRAADAVDDALGRRRESRRLVTPVPDRLGHDFRYALDASKARRELGWEPRVAFDEGLARTVQSCLAGG
jgi:dTDP-glucose 4,6-dehydratase